jgi:TolB protein
VSGAAETDLVRDPFDDWRLHEPGQHSQLRIYDLETGRDSLLLRADEAVIEAPNWSTDGRWLIVNRDGLLYRIATSGDPALELIRTDGLVDSNNDHALSADGRFIYASSKNGHLYEIPFGGGDGGSGGDGLGGVAGGVARQVTDDTDGLLKRYLHGVSPDGTQLSFIGSQQTSAGVTFNVFTAAVTGGAVRQLTYSAKPHDGAEFSPDGAWLYFNSERESDLAGHAQLFRMGVDGSGIQQLTFDDRVNWFPHLSPDGQWMLYLSYQPGTQNHPPNRDVQLRLARPDGTDSVVLMSLFGGQGTVNVNSWAPDSRRFAYVSYPIEGGAGETGNTDAAGHPIAEGTAWAGPGTEDSR